MNWRGRRLPHWTTLLVVLIVIWSLPRLVPHLKALAGIRAQQTALPSFVVRTLAGKVITQDSRQ